jgi:hypothetical protein
MGVMDSHDALMASLGRQPVFCHQMGHETAEQAADVVRLWLEQHPADLSFSAASNVLVALAHAFPCQKASAR